MPQINITTGSAANDGQGQPLRDAFYNIHHNFTELYDVTGDLYPRSNPSQFISSGDVNNISGVISNRINNSGQLGLSKIIDRTVYVSSSGNDSNVGSSVSPFASLTRAAQELGGFGSIVMLEGDYGFQSLDYAAYPKIKIFAERNKFVNVFLGRTVTGFTIHSGSIWKSNLQYSNLPVIVGQNQNFILESGTPCFPVNPTDSHPLQRAKRYRMDHGVISGVTSGDIASVSGPGKWTESGGYLFVYALSGTPANKTYLVPNTDVSGSFFYANSTPPKDSEVYLNGVKVIGGYNGVDLTNVANYELINCSFIGCFNEGVNATNIGVGVERWCEYAANNNDGMGAQTTIAVTGERSRFEIYSAWAHDNGDEGHNGHNNCEITYHGGLFEFNTQSAGVTCALGCKSTLYSPHTRNNLIGISVVLPENGSNGNGTSMNCYNWIAEKDSFGLYNTVGSGDGIVKAFNPTFISIPSAAIASVGAECYTIAYNPSFVNTITKTNPVGGGVIILTGSNTDNWDTTFKRFTFTAQNTGANSAPMIALNDFQGSGDYVNPWIDMQYYLPNNVYSYTPIRMTATRVSPLFVLDATFGLSVGNQAFQIISNRGINLFAGANLLVYNNSILKQRFLANGNYVMNGPSAPVTPSSAGISGEISLGVTNGTGFIYVATGTNAWGRVALSTW